MRPTQPNAFRLSLWHSLKGVLGGQSVNYWVAPGCEKLDGAVRVETRVGCSTVLLDLLVQPERQGQLEAALLTDIIRRLGGRHQPFVTDHPADDQAGEEALRQHHFRPERSLAHMIWIPSLGRGNRAR
jgi:hypothetical protein